MVEGCLEPMHMHRWPYQSSMTTRAERVRKGIPVKHRWADIFVQKEDKNVVVSLAIMKEASDVLH